MFLTFISYQKHPLHVNVAVDINKPKSHDKSVEFLMKTALNIFKKFLDVKIHKEGVKFTLNN